MDESAVSTACCVNSSRGSVSLASALVSHSLTVLGNAIHFEQPRSPLAPEWTCWFSSAPALRGAANSAAGGAVRLSRRDGDGRCILGHIGHHSPLGLRIGNKQHAREIRGQFLVLPPPVGEMPAWARPLGGRCCGILAGRKSRIFRTGSLSGSLTHRG